MSEGHVTGTVLFPLAWQNFAKKLSNIILIINLLTIEQDAIC
jgi:hypothetical protein